MTDLYRQHNALPVSLTDKGEWRNPFIDFDTAVHPGAARAHAAVREWCYTVSRGIRAGLVLWSDDHAGQSGYGCGKTALARMAHDVLNTMRDHAGRPQLADLITASDFFQQIKDAYSANERIEPLFHHWCRGHFIMDDWGKQYTTERGADWMREQFFRLVNRMYDAGHGLLITSNLLPSDIERQIGGASWSRLYGMCGKGGFIDMSAIPDYRLRQGGSE